MQAVVYEGLGSVAVREVPDACIEDPGDALVRVGLAAICRSDLHFLHGKAPLEPGDTIGHEAVGVVEAVGATVRSVSPGDRVVAAFDIACGRCWFCGNGQTQLCDDFRMLGAGIFGGGLGGAQAELVRIPAADTNLLAVPDDLDDERALFLGDVLTTGYYGAALSDIRDAETVAVVGAGPVGFFAGQAAMLRGPGQVLVLDREPDRLERAAKTGVVPVNVTDQHPQTAVDERTDGRGADTVIEAVGDPSALETAVDVVRRGGTVTVLGMYAGESILMPAGVWWTRAIQVRFAGPCPVHAWWRPAMDAVRDGRIDPLPIISHRLPLADAALGYELFDARVASKVLLRP